MNKFYKNIEGTLDEDSYVGEQVIDKGMERYTVYINENTKYVVMCDWIKVTDTSVKFYVKSSTNKYGTCIACYNLSNIIGFTMDRRK